MNMNIVSTEPSAAGLVVSVVSHGHGLDVQRLLWDMARWSARSIHRVVVTHNIPEAPLSPPEGGWPFAVEVVCNTEPRGFGANHNAALQGAKEPFVCVLNPDVELLAEQEPFAALVRVAGAPGVGCAYPVQTGYDGTVQESEREVPSPGALWNRRVRHLPQQRVDWVNAACIVLPQAVWQSIRGFDESYFMYCEDVDLCLRVQLAGWSLQRAPVRVVHTGQRASNRQLRHLVWHVRSLIRLWGSRPYRQFQAR